TDVELDHAAGAQEPQLETRASAERAFDGADVEAALLRVERGVRVERVRIDAVALEVRNDELAAVLVDQVGGAAPAGERILFCGARDEQRQLASERARREVAQASGQPRAREALEHSPRLALALVEPRALHE